MRRPGFEGLLSGHTLADRYHVEEVIGRGGFAAVYRATDERLGRTVAVKVITHTGSPEVGDEIQRRFQREARAIASLHHPNVVTVYDFGTDPVLGLDFLVMEPLTGEVLSDRLRRPEPLPFAEAMRILLDASAGVNAGHRAGLVHRDIKPGNIFLARAEGRSDFRVCVLDFGIARFVEPEATQLTRSGRSFLSPAYASPEQLRGEREITPAADVFSLGVIGYQMLARQRPFRAEHRLHGHADEPPAPLRERNPEVPQAVADAIHRALAEDPADRFPDAGAFAEALAHAQSAADAAPEPVRAAPPPPAAPPAAAPPPPASAPRPAPAAVAATVVDAERTIRPGELLPQGDRSRRRWSPLDDAASMRVGRAGRRMSPAVIAVPALLVLALVAWLVARRGGDGTDTTVTERPAAPASAPAAAPPASAPPAAAPTAAGGGAGSPSPTTSAPGPASPREPAVPVSAPPIGGAQPRPAPSSPPGTRAPVPLPPPSAPPAARPAPASAGSDAAAAVNREGEGLFERGDMAGAVARFRRAVAAAPGSAYYHNNLGWALFQAGQVDEAARELAQAVRLDPRRDIAYANIGEVERVRGNTAAAIAAYERFLELNTDPRREQIARARLRALRGG